jgi:protein-S-isoprenylcysteine O-methyltransferase Ste14
MLAAAGVAMLRFSPLNCLLLVLFIFLQLLRTRWEEAKLTRNFPEYPTFASSSYWFW